MFLGAGEIVVVLAVALMVLGPKKMPEVARQIARFLTQFRRMADEVRTQVDDALADKPKPPPHPQQPSLIAPLHEGPEPAEPSAPHEPGARPNERP